MPDPVEKPISSNRFLITAAWAIMLVVSMLPNALLHELAGGAPAWLGWAKIGLLAALAVTTLFWQTLRPLRNFIVLRLAIFGLGHYFGVPYGVIGVVMASSLGWMMGKAMLETRGFFWAWFIHFLQDVLIFSFMAIGSVTPGG